MVAGTGLKKFAIATCGVGALLMSAAPVAAKQSPITGAWAGTDFFDGSGLHMTVGGGKNHVVYMDDGATVCDTTFGEFSKASGRAFGDISGDTLTVTMDIDCHLSSGKTLWMADLLLTFDYDAGSDTLIDQDGNCYHRPSRPEDCD